MRYVVFSWTCVSSGTALVPSLTTSERWEVWEVLGLEPLNYNKHGFLKRNLPEKGLSPLVLPDDKSGGFRIGLILTCMACFLPSHEYSLGKLLWCEKALMFTRNHPALPLIIKAVLKLWGSTYVETYLLGPLFFRYLSLITARLWCWMGKAEAMVLTNAWHLIWIEAFLLTFHPFSILLQC